MTNRELAWRVFAGEFNASTLEIASNQEREPSYLVTPLGARINRVYIVGVLTEIEKLERNGNTHYRARVSDRTGVFYIYAGQYDIEAVKILSKLEPPTYLAIVGKSRRYSPNEGISYVSIRPESITVVDKDMRDYWLLDTCKSMKTRLSAMHEAQQMAQPDVDKLTALGFDPGFTQGVIDAIEHYKKFDVAFYRNMLFEILKYLATGNDTSYISSENKTNQNADGLDTDFKNADEYTESEDETDDDDELEFEATIEPIEEEQRSETISDQEQQQQLLDLISSFKGKKYKDGVPWHELVVKADSKGFDKNIIEDLVNDLLNNGKVYEPMLGRIKGTSS